MIAQALNLKELDSQRYKRWDLFTGSVHEQMRKSPVRLFINAYQVKKKKETNLKWISGKIIGATVGRYFVNRGMWNKKSYAKSEHFD